MPEDKKDQSGNDGAFVGQIRQNGSATRLRLMTTSRTRQRFTVPAYEQWDGKKWITITNIKNGD